MPKEKNIVIATTKKKDNGILVTAVKLNAEKTNIKEGFRVNDIRTIYYKDIDKFIKHLEELEKSGNVFYINKEKAIGVLSDPQAPIAQGHQHPNSLINNLYEKSKKSSSDLKNLANQQVEQNINITPEKVNLPQIDTSNIKNVWDYFEKNILGKEFTSPIGHKIKLKEGHFFRLIAGSGNKSQRKGFIAKANSPQEAIQLIKEGKIKPEDVFGFEKTRAKYLTVIPDIVQNPQLILKDKKGAYLYVKRYKTNGTDNIVGVFIDVGNKNLGILSLHPKDWKRIENGVKKGKYEIIWTPARFPARSGSVAGSSREAGSPPASTPINNINQPPKNANENIKKLYAGIPTSEVFKSLSKIDNLIYKNITSKIEDTKVDKFLRKYLLADKYGFGSLSRKTEDKVINDYLKLKAHLARGDVSAEKKEKILNKYLDRLEGGKRAVIERLMIQYLENPTIRDRVKKELPQVAQDLDQIRKEIDRLGKLKMERGLITPSQFLKWKDKYLTRLYVMDEDVEGLDITRGIKQYEEKKGRKIESIVDFIEYLKQNDPIKAQEWGKESNT
ncbi:hypothetical protein HG1285_07023 [Hydrogenivirga sp. 128-5-R1-1]|nr:hypothetical protein HG1285_07023 [Hydrogenivirga sp. 128-5-R1-1]